MATNNEHLWQRPEIVKQFTEGVRAAIPLAAEQIDVLLRVVHHALPKVERMLDLGCGDGILGRTLLADNPGAAGVFVDFSEPMLDAAKQKAGSRNTTFFTADLGSRDWLRSLDGQSPFDVVVSGLAIHHLPDERKKELYAEIFGLLKPGGLFLNLEHVAISIAWAEDAYNAMFIDSLWSHNAVAGLQSRDEYAQFWAERVAQGQDILATVESQCQWLSDVGFVDVDCFFKLFALALFGGRKPG